MAIPICSQEIAFKYINIDGYLNLPSITISTIDEYLELVQNQKISSLFLYIDKKDKLDTSVLAKGSDVYYRFVLNGYTSIKDFLNGNELKYTNGQDYYESYELKIFDSKKYYYYKRNNFIKVEDAIDAFENGFVFEKYDLSDVIFPVELTDQIRNVLRQYFPKYAVQTKNIYQDGKIRDIAQSLISIYTLELQKTGIKEDQIYYLANISNISTYKQYLQNYESRKHGFVNLYDSEDASKKGFERGYEYYKAKELGFTSFDDFSIAQRLKIEKPLEYEEYKQIFNNITKYKKEYGMNDEDALICFFISQLPKGMQISIEKLSSNITSMYNQYSKLKNYRSTFNLSLFTVARVEDFLIKQNIIDIGIYNKQSGIFSRKQ